MLTFRTASTLFLTLLLFGCGALVPEGDAGPDQRVLVGETVTLDGTASDKRNGDALTFYWAIVEAPDGSLVTLEGPTTANPTFTPDVAGTYVIELVVDNGYHESDPDQVTVKALSSSESPSVVIAQDASGTVTLYDLEAIENFRNETFVNFSVRYTIENAGSERVQFSFVLFGIDAEDFIIFEHEVFGGLDPGEHRAVTVSFGEALTIEEYDSIVAWEADPIIVY